MRKAVTVEVSCNEDCAATAKGSVLVPQANPRALAAKASKLKLKKDTAQVAAGTNEKLKLKVPRNARNAISKALEAGAKAKAKVSVKVTDAAGNSDRAKRTVRLKL